MSREDALEILLLLPAVLAGAFIVWIVIVAVFSA